MSKNKIHTKKIVTTILQLAISVLALYIVLTKTDTAKLIEVIREANPWYLLLAVIVFNISKILNALRLNRFFRAIGLELSTAYNIQLYYVGMFYNMFLPGGIGGDGYKIYILKKNHSMKMVNVFNAVFWDRVAGIFALLFLTLMLMLPSSFASLNPQYVPLAWVVLVITYPVSWGLTRILYKQFKEIFAITAVESILIQAAQAVAAYFILLALSLPAHHIDYLAIFLVSTVATVLPITVGGAGAREITFFYSLNYLQLEPNTGVALSLIFFAISALSALSGMLFQNRSTGSDRGEKNAQVTKKE
ncbi:TIGR00374 family protein [Prosthecochloris sp. ZM]|uniref:lysylphosphatidylglycerol synthase transmembrane domain-containing protein n=1 Tax=Prosthecochloris sp. ZM TaxID=2283143 RepID=UPI000DF75E4C|nr:lysylphosphatidylglycerol synthase transmembrane domain-containing protein [Prosthecochloris sp. ZM]RDD29770.1 TIGR00374 family protein [Prosthecochloris sp. ZM]